MPNIGFRVHVPVSPEELFEHVTRFPVTGHPSRRVLEERYGRMLGQDGNEYTFEDSTNGELRWRCIFDAPRQRVMRVLESNWADRIDWFEPSGEGTDWTVAWELKTTGLRAYTQWLHFQLSGKKRTYEQVVTPVLRHFSQPSPQQAAPPRSAPLESVAEEEDTPPPEAAETQVSDAEDVVTPPAGDEAAVETQETPQARTPRPRVRRRRRS